MWLKVHQFVWCKQNSLRKCAKIKTGSEVQFAANLKLHFANVSHRVSQVMRYYQITNTSLAQSEAYVDQTKKQCLSLIIV